MKYTSTHVIKYLLYNKNPNLFPNIDITKQRGSHSYTAAVAAAADKGACLPPSDDHANTSLSLAAPMVVIMKSSNYYYDMQVSHRHF